MIKKFAVIVLIFILLVVGISILSKKPKKKFKAAPAIKGRIAIVLDDWGYSLNNLRSLEEIKYPLTASILPNLIYTRKVSEELHSRGIEVILHFPMEPNEKMSEEVSA